MTLLARALLVGMLTFSAAAIAAPQLQLETITEREITTTDADGNTRTERVVTSEVEPGDVLFITLKVTNSGDEAATSVNLENPIPQGTELVPNSPWGDNAEITYSTNQGRFFAPAKELTVPKNTIGLSTRPATTADYTHIRWVVERVEVGNTITVGFSAIVN